MEQLVSTLSTDKYVLAIANIAALIGAVFLIFRAFRWIFRFTVNVYRTNWKSAVYKYKRRSFRTSYLCATDLYFFVSYVVRLSLLIALVLVAIIVGMSAANTSPEMYLHRHPGATLADFYHFENTSKIIGVVAITTFYSTLFLFVSRLQAVCLNVTRLRRKWRQRGQLL